jgi:hypothetical protein
VTTAARNATNVTASSSSGARVRVRVIAGQPLAASKAAAATQTPSAAPQGFDATFGKPSTATSIGKNGSNVVTSSDPAGSSPTAPLGGSTAASAAQQFISKPEILSAQRKYALGPQTAVLSGLKALTPVLLKQPGAQKMLLVGCLLQQQVPTKGGFATFEAMKLAVQDMLPQMKPPVNVNLTCFETQVS